MPIFHYKKHWRSHRLYEQPDVKMEERLRKRPRRFTPEEVARQLTTLRNISDDQSDADDSDGFPDSCDSSDDLEMVGDNSGSEIDAGCSSDSCSEGIAEESADTDDDHPAAPARKRSRGASCPATSTVPAGSYIGKDGTEWEKSIPSTGRCPQRNILRQAHGLPRRTKLCATNEMESFFLMISPSIIQTIIKCTNTEAKRVKGDDYSNLLDEAEFLAFLGLFIARGVLCARNEPVAALWSAKYGRDLFRSTMARNRYSEILRFLRFDDRAQRSRRVGQDKFYLIREVWDRFVSNCISEYHPSPFLTVDEQLLPTKARCPFTQYMPNKPGKFGIKFWMLADAEKPYIMNVRPYLGKNFDDERGGVQLGEHVVLKLMEPFIDKGYNVTTDNFFTSLRLAKQLGRKKTTLVGTMRGNRKEMPPSFTAKKRQLHSVLQGHNVEASCTLLSSQVKKAKVVNVLSAMHGIEPVPQDGSTKPAIIEFYNSTKFGVDRVDQMCRLYSSKAGGRRWPVSVFSNMIDMAGINSRTIFELASGNSISRRQFLLNLAEQLVESYRSSRSVSEPLPAISQQSEQRRKCHICHKNKTRVACSKCGKPLCGKCTKPVVCRKC